MKLLLDENIDIRFKHELAHTNAFTLFDMDWAGLKNGELREKANEANFTFFLTADKNLPFQQNLDKIRFNIVLLDTPTLLWEHQVLFIPKIKQLIEMRISEGIKIIHISIEGFGDGKKKQQLKKVFQPQQILFI